MGEIQIRICETCDVRVTWANAQQHPNGLGGHVVNSWVLPLNPSSSKGGDAEANSTR